MAQAKAKKPAPKAAKTPAAKNDDAKALLEKMQAKTEDGCPFC